MREIPNINDMFENPIELAYSHCSKLVPSDYKNKKTRLFIRI